ERVERLLHLLADHIGGDHEVAHVAALMRLAGSWNSKRAAPVLTRIIENRPAARYEIEDLEEWLADASRPLLVARPRPQTNGGGDAFADYASSVPVSPDALLAEMAVGSIHEIQTKVIASLVARGEASDVIDQKVLDATKRAYAKGGVTRTWNWDKELRA